MSVFPPVVSMKQHFAIMGVNFKENIGLPIAKWNVLGRRQPSSLLRVRSNQRDPRRVSRWTKHDLINWPNLWNHPSFCSLQSRLDWIDLDFILFVNSVLSGLAMNSLFQDPLKIGQDGTSKKKKENWGGQEWTEVGQHFLERFITSLFIFARVRIFTFLWLWAKTGTRLCESPHLVPRVFPFLSGGGGPSLPNPSNRLCVGYVQWFQRDILATCLRLTLRQHGVVRMKA